MTPEPTPLPVYEPAGAAVQLGTTCAMPASAKRGSGAPPCRRRLIDASLRFIAVAGLTRLLQTISIIAMLWVMLAVLPHDFARPLKFVREMPFVVLLDLWMVAEVAFFFYYTRQIARAQERQRLAVVPKHERQRAFQRALELSMGEDPGAFLSPWFHGAPISQIYRENLRDWLAWAFFCSEPHELTREESAEIDEQIACIEAKSGYALQPGRNPGVRAIRLAFDPVPVRHRPLVVYGAVAAARAAVLSYLRSCGFKRRTIGQLTYHVWEAVPGAAEGAALVFVHGIGVGVMPYVQLISRVRHQMRTGGGGAIFMTEMPYVSMELGEHDIPSPAQVVDDMERMLTTHGYRRAVFAGHSLGTTHVAWMIKRRPERVAGAMFIDPIVFLLCRADVAYNFLYRTPRRWNEEFIHFFASRELGVARALHRHFCWISNSLWPEDLTSRTVVALSSEDGIVPARHVEAFLRTATPSAPLDVLYMEGIRHAGFLGSPKHLAAITSKLTELLEYAQTPQFG